MDARQQSTAPKRPARRWLAAATVLIALLALLWLWNWNWFRPLLEAKASAAIGRPVTIGRLDVSPGRVTGVTLYGVKVANPPGQPGDFVSIPRLSLTFDPIAWWRSGQLVLRTVQADQPDIDVEQAGTGQGNWPRLSNSSALQVGALAILGGAAHVHIAREETNVTMTIATKTGPTGDAVVIDGQGTHARQPISFHAVGGAVLALRDPNNPWPIDFELANGPTKITLRGHIQDPMALRGADLNLLLTGPDMALLLPLTGIATPQTPAYRVSGHLHFRDGQVRFTDIDGRVGSSDLSGALTVDPRPATPVVTGDLRSHQVDLADLGGFIGSTPGRVSTPGQSKAQVAAVERAEASPKLLPTAPISLPKLHAADVHLTYRGDKILGEHLPFDSIAVKLDIDNGAVHLTPLRLGIGDGTLSGTIGLTPAGNVVDADANVAVRNVNLGRLLASGRLGQGAGAIDGTAVIKGKGASLSAILAHGDGALDIVMPRGGDISSLLIDLTGIELGKALFAAIGVPSTEAITCARADFVLRDGILASRALEVGTADHVITGGGRIDLGREVMELTLRTDPRHFTIGSLPTPIEIYGPLKHLRFGLAPDAAARGGAAIGLGLLFPPAAILPTIQFGVGDASPCASVAPAANTRSAPAARKGAG